PLPVRVLHGELEAVEAGGLEALEARAVEGHAARDEVDVELARARLGDELLDVVAHERLAAREVDLQDPERRRLAEDALPRRPVELGGVLVELDGVRAVAALERAAVRQLRDERVRSGRLDRRRRRRQADSSTRRPRSSSERRKARTSSSM